MESVSTFEQVLQQEKHIVAQQLRQRMRRELEELRPGLLELLRTDGFELYALEERLCVRRGNEQGYLRLEQLKKAQQESQAALLELFDASVRPDEQQIMDMRKSFFVMLVLGTVFIVYLGGVEHIPGDAWISQTVVGVWVVLVLLYIAGGAWPQLQAWRPWRDLYKQTPPSGDVSLLSPEENPAVTDANAQ